MVHNPFVKLPFKIVSKFYPDFSLLPEIFKFFATCSIRMQKYEKGNIIRKGIRGNLCEFP